MRSLKAVWEFDSLVSLKGLESLIIDFNFESIEVQSRWGLS